MVDDPEFVEEELWVVAAQQFVRDHGDEPGSIDGRLLGYYVETLVNRLRLLRADLKDLHEAAVNESLRDELRNYGNAESDEYGHISVPQELVLRAANNLAGTRGGLLTERATRETVEAAFPMRPDLDVKASDAP